MPWTWRTQVNQRARKQPANAESCPPFAAMSNHSEASWIFPQVRAYQGRGDFDATRPEIRGVRQAKVSLDVRPTHEWQLVFLRRCELDSSQWFPTRSLEITVFPKRQLDGASLGDLPLSGRRYSVAKRNAPRCEVGGHLVGLGRGSRVGVLAGGALLVWSPIRGVPIRRGGRAVSLGQRLDITMRVGAVILRLRGRAVDRGVGQLQLGPIRPVGVVLGDLPGPACVLLLLDRDLLGGAEVGEPQRLGRFPGDRGGLGGGAVEGVEGLGLGQPRICRTPSAKCHTYRSKTASALASTPATAAGWFSGSRVKTTVSTSLTMS